MNFQGGWSFHDWAEAIKNGVCPPNQEIIRLFQVNVEPETEIAQVAWGAYREYGSSTKKLLDKFNPGDEIQEMLPKFEEWERHIFNWLLFLVGNDNSRKILAFMREWVALTFKGEYEDKDKVSKPSSQELAKEIVALALKQSVHENDALVTEQSVTTSATENLQFVVEKTRLHRERSQSEPSRSFNKQDVDGTQSENDFYSDIEIEDFSQREKLVARKLVNLFKVCQRHNETKTMLEYFVDIYLRQTQFKDLSNNYPWNDFWKLIERLAGFNFDILKAQLRIVVETVNQYNELNDLIVLWSKYIKKVVHFHDYSSQTIADGQILVNRTHICIDKYFPVSVAIIRTEILKLLDGLLNNQAISRHIRATGKMRKCFRSPSGLRLEKEIITEIIICVFRKMTKQIGYLSIMGSSMSKKLKIGDFKIPLKAIWPAFVQVESDRKFKVKLDHIPIMDKRIAVAFMLNGLKPAISKIPINFKNAFFEIDDFIDIDCTKGIGIVIKLSLQNSLQLFSDIEVVATAPKIKYCFSNSKYLAFRIFKGRVDYKVQKYFEWFVEKRLEEFTKDLGICLGFVMETFLTEAKMNCMSVVTESLLELLECCNSRAN